MLIYLAVPMDAYDDPVDIADVMGTISRTGHVAYLPSRATVGGMNDPEATYRLNQAALYEADALLAIWPPMASSWGVPMEVREKYDSGAPVVVVGAESSMQLAALGVHRERWDDPDAIEKAVKWLAERESGAGHLRLVDPTVQFTGDSMSVDPVLRWAGDPTLAPVKKHADDAGWDLFVSEDTLIPYGGFKDVPCGIRIELPPGYFGRITGRSSTIRKRKLLVNEGIIDTGFRGELFAAVWNMSNDPWVPGRDNATEVKRGDRIAQLLVHRVADLVLERADVLSRSERGENGFGSTGA